LALGWSLCTTRAVVAHWGNADFHGAANFALETNSWKLRQLLQPCILDYVAQHGGADESRPRGKG
jgi:hypothetical protein